MSSEQPFAERLGTERFTSPSWAARVENAIGLLVVKPFIWASAFAADLLREWAPAPLSTISPHPIWRRAGNGLTRLTLSAPEGVAVSRAKIRGVDVERLAPKARAEAVVLYFHGGGFVIGGPSSHRLLTGRLALESGATVLVPDYRKPPQTPFTRIVDDCLAVYRQLLADGTDPRRIVFAGDSAGGYLTVAVAQAARAAGLPLPAGLVPLAPWLDLRKAINPVGTRTEYLIPLRWTKSVVAQLVAPHGPEALASPTDRDLAGLPPTLVQVSSAEVLYPEAVRLAEALAAAAVPVRLQVWDGVMHVFQLAGGLVPESRQAIASIAEFVRTTTAPAQKASAHA
ncbi:MAG: alpha/beta hydrolase [Segniliparus sp.]|uniref:alpha/beta hydrolase n=1 Tax=Segniliparus sp. TaxID=2804064 RepID=UPI003F3AE5CB